MYVINSKIGTRGFSLLIKGLIRYVFGKLIFLWTIIFAVKVKKYFSWNIFSRFFDPTVKTSPFRGFPRNVNSKKSLFITFGLK